MLIVKVGDIIRFEVGVRGKLFLEVLWIKDKDVTDLIRLSRVKIDISVDLFRFFFIKVKRSDGGKYVIIVINIVGSFVVYVIVNVLDKFGFVRNLKIIDVFSDRCIICWDLLEDDGGCEI